MNRTRAVTLVVLALLAGVAIALWFKGATYYTTHPWDRAAVPDQESLRSSGAWGHGLGIAGTALIILNLTFMLRRRLASFRRFGALSLWMNMHVLTGLFGPLVVVYHTAFDPRTSIAIGAFVSLGVLVVTGVVGRFIYAMIPRTVAGAEQGPEELAARLAAARDHLAKTVPADAPVWREIEDLARPGRLAPRSSLGALLLLPHSLVASALLRVRLWRLDRAHRDMDWHDLNDLVLIRRRLGTLGLYRKLLAWWRGLHRVAAVVMIVTLAVHVVVLLYLGYTGGA